MIKFYYFYTPDYEFWNNHLSTTLSGSFDVQPLHLCRFKTPTLLGVSSGKGNVTTRILNARRCKNHSN
jgi:hypothetical protein